MSSRRCHVKESSCWIIWLVLSVVLLSAAYGRASEPLRLTAVPVIDTDRLEQRAAQAPGETGRWQSRFPKHPELYVPMPVPQRRESDPGVQSANRQVIYNIKTRQETFRSPESWSSAVQSAQSGQRQTSNRIPSVGGSEGFGSKNFTDPTPIFDPAEYPWRVNCKLFMKFVDETGTYAFRGWGSGVLIDPTHVLTAAHCIYEHDVKIGDTVYPINGWAEEVVVVPAYEEERRPYGDGTAVDLSASEGWTVDWDHDHDIGIIQLDRPLGPITGWHGYASAADPAFYTENTFNNAGYPMDPPFDGEYMWYWYGPFDYTDYDTTFGGWLGNTVSIDRSGYHGQSGSGAYISTDAGRFVHAVMSYGYLERTYFVRITPDKRDEITDFIVGSTPTEPDLVPLYTQVETPTVSAGRPVTDMWFLLHNNSSSRWTGRVLVAAFLSGDRIISTADTHLGQFYIDWTFEPRSTVLLTFPPVWIPSSVHKGSHWLGIYLLTDDSDGTNDMTSVQDVAPIVVDFPKLTNNTPETYATGPRDFAFDVVGTDWCCIGISPSRNYDLKVYDNPDFMGSYARSTYSGTARDFVVANGHEWGDTTHFARVGQMVGGNYAVEATWHVPDLSVGVERLDTMDDDEVHEIYEMYLVAGTHYQLDLDMTSGAGDLSVYVFKPTQKSGSRSSYGWMANQNGDRQGEHLSFTATSSGYHAIVVINENTKSAEYSLIVQP